MVSWETTEEKQNQKPRGMPNAKPSFINSLSPTEGKAALSLSQDGAPGDRAGISAKRSGSGSRLAAAVKPEGEVLGPGGAACVAAVAGVCGLQGAGPAVGLCRDAGAGGAEGGGSPPGAAQCGGSFQPVSGWRVATTRRRAAESRARRAQTRRPGTRAGGKRPQRLHTAVLGTH